MDLIRIARILYCMAIGLDYADGIAVVEEEINCIEKELQLLKDHGCDSLSYVLEMIALGNEKLEFLYKHLQNDAEN